MFCSRCGNQLAEESKFCSECGAAIQTPETTEFQTQSSVQPPSVMNDQKYVASLLEYLRDILQCESSLIGYESAVQQIREIMARLCVPRVLSKPPSKPVPPQEMKSFILSINYKIVISGILSVLPGINFITIPYCIYQIYKSGKQKAKEVYERNVESYNQKLINYEEKEREYKDAVNDENMRISSETAQKQLYQDQTDRLNELIACVKETLSALYGTNILHPKYQNFVAAASIFDYLSTGRTASLVHTNSDTGAYNIYEEDVRANKIINSIGMVGSQIVSAVKDMDQSMRYYNQSICNAIENASELQNSKLSDISAQLEVGRNDMNKANELKTKQQAEISEYLRLQTAALHEHTPYGVVISDKSGFGVS